ncbi:hypothetical protein LY474_35640 [Myxococcus stipitatus]|uniref:DUF6843 domain-containing protein n=1 Tax=Myxococcus stipitatus TaxID=83455 RepID=UPI001F164F39|nr:hypothetical protein [Myxococcus stipitatus]MCE9673154.1 hypothetical protein [Myxococcus stipitatus]
MCLFKDGGEGRLWDRLNRNPQVGSFHEVTMPDAIRWVVRFGLKGVAVFMWLALGACNNATPEVHLIPAGYQGPVVIIFNMPEGQPVDSRERIYRIGPDGVLAVQAPPNQGVLTSKELRFYYEYKDGTRERIPIGKALPENVLQVFGRYSRGIYRRAQHGDAKSVHVIEGEVYAVGIPSQMGDWGEKANVMMERWVDAKYGPNPSSPAPDAMTP